VDIPFDKKEVARAAGEDYVDSLGPSDMPVVEMPLPETLPYYCAVGEKVCDIYKKLGNTCKAGLKTSECPQLNKVKSGKEKGGKAKGADARRLIGIDMPFDYEEVVSVTGPEYVRQLQHEGVGFVPYEELKRNRARGGGKKRDIIDLDVPFDRDEVARATGEAYADTLGPSDMPAVEVPAPEALQYYCAVGDKVCDVFKKLGNTCKAGMKTSECPQLKKVKKGAAKKKAAFDPGRLIGVEMPFAYEEVVAVTGHEFMENLDRGGVPPYETLKARVAGALEKEATRRAVVRKFPQRALTDEILVIDDEVAVNNNIRKILSKKGYEVEQAMTKEEALTRIGEKAYRVVLLDLKIPGVQGLELLRTIRDRSPETLVIIITGYASIETAKESARLGAVDYLPKPFTPDEVRKATEKAIRMAA
ncbi:MAG: response regulator, partial [Deltaproteobacteria bacterium]|nr:response regulator [Deltaproteobacteria bacterium]